MSERASEGVVKLHRNLGARLIGGSRLRGVLSVLFVLDLVVTIAVAVLTAGGPVILPLSLALLFAAWAFGFAASATCEADGVAWRFVGRHAFLWKDVKAVRFSNAPSSYVGAGTRPVIVVAVDRFDYDIAPATGVARDRLVAFGQELARFAAARGVEVTVDAAHWGDLRRSEETR